MTEERIHYYAAQAQTTATGTEPNAFRKLERVRICAWRLLSLPMWRPEWDEARRELLNALEDCECTPNCSEST